MGREEDTRLIASAVLAFLSASAWAWIIASVHSLRFAVSFSYGL